MTQALLTQAVALLGQALPHLPQLALSVASVVQLVPHFS
jgi:hypothetical protein